VLIGLPNEIPFYEWDATRSQQPEHNERFEVTVITAGTFEEARQGHQTGRTIVQALPPGSEGVRIPRSMNVPKFWAAIEDCLERADEVNKTLAESIEN
jgi:uridine nucleosidase